MIMISFFRQLIFLLLCSTLVLTSNHQSALVAAAAADEEECTLYMSKSTIPNAGLGIFTTVDLKKGDHIGYGDVEIPIIEIYDNIIKTIDILKKKNKNNSSSKNYDQWYNYNPFSEYVWAGKVMGMQAETSLDGDRIDAYCPGLNSAINCNLALINVDKYTNKYNNPFIRAENDHPMVGSISPYENSITYATTNIPSGSELFKFYGDDWFTGQRELIFGKYFPLTGDYPRADRLLQKFHNKFIKNNITMKEDEKEKTEKDAKTCKSCDLLPTHIKEELWHITTDFDYKSRTITALPEKMDEALRGANDGIKSLHQPNAIRSKEELKKDGVCLDNIYNDISTVKEAGRGAFASRLLKKGSLVTSSPLIHITAGKDIFIPMHDNTKGRKRKNRRRKEDDKTNKDTSAFTSIINKQIVLNYCYGHAESTLLLCPYGTGINYINHSFDKSKVNIKIQWTAHDKLNMGNESYIQELFHNDLIIDNKNNNNNATTTTTTTLQDISKPVLAFDYIATQDIQKDDELFMDYGKEWETAYKKFVKDWKKKMKKNHQLLYQDYMDAYTYNKLNNESKLLTINEILDIYDNEDIENSSPCSTCQNVVNENKLLLPPDNLELHCHSDLVKKDLIEEIQQKSASAANTNNNNNIFDGFFQWRADDDGYLCNVTQRYRSSPGTSSSSSCSNDDGDDNESTIDLDDDSDNDDNALCNAPDDDEEYLYDVEIEYYSLDTQQQEIGQEESDFQPIRNKQINNRLVKTTRMNNVPRNALLYHNKPYTTDIHLPNVFRHEINIPNDMFPNKWKNI